jgi:D-glycero-D-manno-heptose 1,7-bisphosphate phosphatase
MNRAVFLDRDGVINRVVLRGGRPYPPASPDDLQFLPDVGDAIGVLRRAGFRIVVVTNQPDVARGAQRREVVEAIHSRIQSAFQIDDFKVCYHVDEDGCACRKPKPGMLLEAAAQWSLDMVQSFMVGDRWRDVAAGKAAGCRTILIDRRYAERPAENPDAVVDSLWEASQHILSAQIFGGINA